MSSVDLKNIKLVCFDVDGVLTDGRVIIDDAGRETKFFHSRDGHGLKMLMRAGLEVAIITGRKSRVVENRTRELGITEVHQGVTDKLAAYNEILTKFNLAPHEVAMAGDDIVDLPVMRRCGLALAPADAAPEVAAVAHFITSLNGGRGAARQMVEYILKGQGLWESVIAKYYE